MQNLLSLLYSSASEREGFSDLWLWVVSTLALKSEAEGSGLTHSEGTQVSFENVE